ncbi:hypothetical protein SNEBB_003064 [Seison nebaliae]|nr:hypothetical protein SNEBB_003064 [Seison nebaliae]
MELLNGVTLHMTKAIERSSKKFLFNMESLNSKIVKDQMNKLQTQMDNMNENVIQQMNDNDSTSSHGSCGTITTSKSLDLNKENIKSENNLKSKFNFHENEKKNKRRLSYNEKNSEPLINESKIRKIHSERNSPLILDFEKFGRKMDDGEQLKNKGICNISPLKSDDRSNSQHPINALTNLTDCFLSTEYKDNSSTSSKSSIVNVNVSDQNLQPTKQQNVLCQLQAMVNKTLNPTTYNKKLNQSSNYMSNSPMKLINNNNNSTVNESLMKKYHRSSNNGKASFNDRQNNSMKLNSDQSKNGNSSHIANLLHKTIQDEVFRSNAFNQKSSSANENNLSHSNETSLKNIKDIDTAVPNPNITSKQNESIDQNALVQLLLCLQSYQNSGSKSDPVTMTTTANKSSTNLNSIYSSQSNPPTLMNSKNGENKTNIINRFSSSLMNCIPSPTLSSSSINSTTNEMIKLTCPLCKEDVMIPPTTNSNLSIVDANVRRIENHINFHCKNNPNRTSNMLPSDTRSIHCTSNSKKYIQLSKTLSGI